MSDREKANTIVRDLMFKHDAFSIWMGIDILEVNPGTCKLKAIINKDMLNGFNICHGGITYSLADSALAFASNSHGIQAVSVETSMSHTKAVNDGDIIIVEAKEISVTTRFGVYQVTLHNQNDVLIGLMKGTVYRTDKLWFTDVQDADVAKIE